MPNKTIYQLNLHERLVINASQNGAIHLTESVMRVAGGWIYLHTRLSETGATETSTFVPYSDEFVEQD